MGRLPRSLAPLLAALAVALAAGLAGCQGLTAGPVPAPVLNAADVTLRQGDVPAGLARCTESGRLADYGKSTGPPTLTAMGWDDLHGRGADQAVITMYSDQAAACGAEMGATTGARSLSAVTVRFETDDLAGQGFARGILGFTTPDGGQVGADLTIGPETGLGADSWAYSPLIAGRSTYLALWHRHRFAILLFGAGVSLDEARSAAIAVDGRIG